MILTDGWQFRQNKEGRYKRVANRAGAPRLGHRRAFDKKWDLQKVAIEQNGGKRPQRRAAAQVPYPGSVPDTTAASSSHRVVNGQNWCLMGPCQSLRYVSMVEGWLLRAYGYNAFRVDITPFMKPGENQLDVDLLNIEESSRWYPGAGLYRPVKLVMTGKICLDEWGTFIRTLLRRPEQRPCSRIVTDTACHHHPRPPYRMVDIMDARANRRTGREPTLGIGGCGTRLQHHATLSSDRQSHPISIQVRTPSL